MSYQVLARKWRPRRFDELVGQKHVVRALANALDQQRLHHAYLFTGTRGVGKTTVARILARSLNCETGVTSTPCGRCTACTEIDEGRFVDLIEVDAASRTGVDDTRDLLENVQYAPTRGRYKVYLIDEVHMFSNSSFNALLKTLEEPPPHVKFLLATTDPKKLPVTILSRCLQFNLRRLLPEEIEAQLARITAAEGVSAEAGALRLLATAADGSLRDALSLLDQAIADGGGRLMEAEVAAMLGTIDRDQVYRVLERLADADAPGLLAVVADMAAAGCDFDAALAELLGSLQRIAVRQVLGERAPADDDTRIAALAARIAPEDCQLYYQIGLLGRRDLALAPDPRGGFEMTLLRMLAFRPAGEMAAPPPASDGGARRTAAAALPAQPGPQEWEQAIDAMELTGLARELAANCVLDGVEDGTFRLRLDPRCAHLRNARLEQRLEEWLRARYGAGVRLQLTVAEAADAETPVARRARREREQQDAAAQAIAADPNVQAICARFDARVEATSARGDPAEGRPARHGDPT